MTDEGLLKEYEALRNEVLHSDRITLEAISITAAAAGLILAQGVASGSALVCLIPIPVLCVAYVYLASKRWVIWVIASYCRRYIEIPSSGIRWETRLRGFRRHRIRMTTSRYWWVSTFLTEYLIFVVLGAASAGCSAALALADGMDWLFYFAPGVLLLVLVTVATCTYRDLRRAGGAPPKMDACWSARGSRRVADAPLGEDRGSEHAREPECGPVRALLACWASAGPNSGSRPSPECIECLT
jgi:hypothetical protein